MTVFRKEAEEALRQRGCTDIQLSDEEILHAMELVIVRYNVAKEKSNNK